jgi:hypothetical protein
MKKLPIGIQSFEKIRKEDYLYVDKTEYIYRLVTTGTPTFLITLLKKRNSVESFLQPIQASEAVFGSYNPERLETLTN